MLSKEQMKKIMGGVVDWQEPGEGGGNRCVLYCCPNEGNCSGQAAQGSYNMSCQSNEDCQSWGVGAGASCGSGFYVAALCK